MATKPTRAYGYSKENYHSNFILYRYLNQNNQRGNLVFFLCFIRVNC